MNLLQSGKHDGVYSFWSGSVRSVAKDIFTPRDAVNLTVQQL